VWRCGCFGLTGRMDDGDDGAQHSRPRTGVALKDFFIADLGLQAEVARCI